MSIYELITKNIPPQRLRMLKVSGVRDGYVNAKGQGFSVGFSVPDHAPFTEGDDVLVELDSDEFPVSAWYVEKVFP